jgi:hypothetical protein
VAIFQITFQVEIEAYREGTSTSDPEIQTSTGVEGERVPMPVRYVMCSLSFCLGLSPTILGINPSQRKNWTAMIACSESWLYTREFHIGTYTHTIHICAYNLNNI